MIKKKLNTIVKNAENVTSHIVGHVAENRYAKCQKYIKTWCH